jgi:hypothetical protein
MKSALPVLLLIAGSIIPAQQAVIFEFHSGFWVNLHQYLYDQAPDEKAPATGSPAWREAVDYYRRELVKHNLLDDDMAVINSRLSQAGGGPAPGVDGALAEVLRKVAAEYRKEFWPKHDEANRAWIAAVQPLIEKYGDRMKNDIASAFQTRWPAEPVRTEVSAKAGWAGAYTTNGPTLITVSSTNPDYQGLASLERLFHEASHSLDVGVNRALSAELAARKLLFQRRGFGHAVLHGRRDCQAPSWRLSTLRRQTWNSGARLARRARGSGEELEAIPRRPDFVSAGRDRRRRRLWSQPLA